MVRIRLERSISIWRKNLKSSNCAIRSSLKVQDRVQQTQREYYLREQIKAIQKELGEQDEGARDTEDLKQKIGIRRHARRSKERSPEGAGSSVAQCPRWLPTNSVTRNYIEWLRFCPGRKLRAEKLKSRKRKRFSIPITTTCRR